MRSTCVAIVYFVKRSSSRFWYFEARVRYRRKKYTFAISSHDEFLLPSVKGPRVIACMSGLDHTID